MWQSHQLCKKITTMHSQHGLRCPRGTALLDSFPSCISPCCHLFSLSIIPFCTLPLLPQFLQPFPSILFMWRAYNNITEGFVSFGRWPVHSPAESNLGLTLRTWWKPGEKELEEEEVMINSLLSVLRHFHEFQWRLNTECRYAFL